MPMRYRVPLIDCPRFRARDWLNKQERAKYRRAVNRAIDHDIDKPGARNPWRAIADKIERLARTRYDNGETPLDDID